MSLFRKIRRRHKAFALKRSAQIHGDKAASVFPVDDGEDGDEGEDTDFEMDSLQQADEQNGDILVSAGHETHQRTFCMEHFPVQTDDSAQSSIIILADSGSVVGQGMQIVGKESRFWFRIAKTAAFMLVTVGAFSVGKLAAMGITLTVALAFKLFGRDQINSGQSFISAETKQSHRSHESLPSNTEMVGRDNEETDMIGSEASLVDESNGAIRLLVSHVVTDASGHTQETSQAHSEEALDFKASGETLLAQRKKLKRLNCIKIPPSASPFVETMEDSPSSSARSSPRAWFRNVRNSTPTGKGTGASSAEMNNQGKFKPKELLRHLRRKGEPQSAPSSPLSSSREGSNNFSIALDGSDTERSAHPMGPVHRRSKFRPASPEKEANAIMGLPHQQPWQTLAVSKGERTSLPATPMESEAIATNAAIRKYEMETSTFMPAGREILMTEEHIPTPLQAVEKGQATFLPATSTLRDVTMEVDIHSPLASTPELPHQRREKVQSLRRSVTLVSQGGITPNAVTSMNQDSVAVAVQERGEMRRKQVRVEPPWVTAGLMIMLAGLFGGRMMAVIGLVCYWYLLSFKSMKASERKR